MSRSGKLVATLVALLLFASVAAVAYEPPVVEVRMTLSEDGNGFVPSQIKARRGDIVRFINVDGLRHNVSFPRKDNPEGVALPPRSPMLTAAGQTYDLTIELPPGTYTFQCDPHVEMGMVGTLVVE